MNWFFRPVFGVLLAVLALAAMIDGRVWFAAFIGAITIAGVREWHRMVTGGSYLVYGAISVVAIAAALALPLAVPPASIPVPVLILSLLILAVAAVLNLAVAASRGARPLWQAAGPLYLGVPGVALFGLRTAPQYGLWLVLILFVAIWAADTGALFSGKLIGGPKLAPVLSPNKTWAGLVGGTALAAAAGAAVTALLGGGGLRGAAFGLALALVGHAGDLFESWVKRRVGRKDSGHLIPGHGGVLDRIDSILFAAPAFAVFVFLFGAQSIFGAQP